MSAMKVSDESELYPIVHSLFFCEKLLRKNKYAVHKAFDDYHKLIVNLQPKEEIRELLIDIPVEIHNLLASFFTTEQTILALLGDIELFDKDMRDKVEKKLNHIRFENDHTSFILCLRDFVQHVKPLDATIILRGNLKKREGTKVISININKESLWGKRLRENDKMKTVTNYIDKYSEDGTINLFSPIYKSHRIFLELIRWILKEISKKRKLR